MPDLLQRAIERERDAGQVRIPEFQHHRREVFHCPGCGRPKALDQQFPGVTTCRDCLAKVGVQFEGDLT